MEANRPEDHKNSVETELQRIEEDCIYSGKAQFNAADRWNRYHYFFGIPTVVLSALASAAFLADESILAVGMSALIAILTAIQTFVKPSEKASAHKSAGDQYLSLRNDTRVFREIRVKHVCDAQAAIDGVESFSKRRNELNATSPAFSRRDFEKARKGIEEGEAKHVFDK